MDRNTIVTKESPFNLTVLENQHRSIRLVAETFSIELVNQFHKVLKDSGITLGFPIQSRVKEWPSFAEKIERLSMRLDSVTDMQDFVGIRTILLFRRDVVRVSRLIETHFVVRKKYDTLDRLGADRFGYSSYHYVIELPKEWLVVPTFAKSHGLQAEIQVRTLAQHIWAEASHDLQYKKERSVPTEILRSIYRVSALLETVDLEFERVLAQRETYRKEADVSSPTVELNVDLIETILNSRLPPGNKVENENFAELLEELALFEISTPQALNQLIAAHLDAAINADRKAVQDQISNLQHGRAVTGAPVERIESGVYFTYVGLVRTMMRRKFGVEFDKRRQARAQK